MKTLRNSREVKKSIFKGLDEAIAITKSISVRKNPGVKTSASNKNNGKVWSFSEERNLKTLARRNTPARVIGLKLGRTPGAILSKASDLKVSLKQATQSPYNRKK